MGSRCIHLWILCSVLFAFACGGNGPAIPGQEAGPNEDAKLDGGGGDATDAATDAETDATPTDSMTADTPPSDAGTDAAGDATLPDSPPGDATPPDSPPPDAGVDAPPPDAPPSCPANQQLCGGLCKDTSSDPDFCGASCSDCGTGVCSAGKCCPSGQTNCNGTCVDLDDGGANGTNCGACGTNCNAGNACSAGKCCPTGETNCSGTCRDTEDDPFNCGGCGIICSAGSSCLSGQCCPQGQVNCNGVCVDLDDGGPGKQNCGTCGTTCGASETCEDGKCCTTGQDNCNGVCTDTSNNDLNCGACGNPCGPGEVCSDSQCVPNCVAGQTLCNGACINTLNDPNNCGGCGTTCTGGKTCSNSACSCPANAPDTCGGQCVDKDSDPNNCGDCGTSCANGSSCTDGKCCPDGQTNCNGTCVDTLADEDNCGICGITCGSGSTCTAGICECGFNQENCDGECVTVGVDPNNCGACGNSCGVGEVCVSNGCIASCPNPLTECPVVGAVANECVNPDTDNDNCGGCGNKCGAGLACSEGVCIPPVVLDPPPPGKCDNGGPPINPFPGGGGGCTGQVAGVTFTFALCSCTDIDSTKIIVTDGFDSTQGPYVPGQNGAGIGVNVGEINSNDKITVGGDLFIAGANGLETVGDFQINQRLFVDAKVHFADLITVNEDSFIGGAITRQGGNVTFKTLDVLTTPSCTNLPGGVTFGSCVPAAVQVDPPCDCNSTTNNGNIDVRSIVTFHSNPANNDNASIGLSQALLDAPSGPIRLDLPCGKYYLNSIQGSAPITIVAHGHVGLFIGGSIAPSQALNFDLDPTATLDVFVGGVQKATNAGLVVGNPLYPRLTRFFIGSASTSGSGSCSINSDCTSGRCINGTCANGGGNLSDAFQSSGNSFLNGLFYAGTGRVFISNPLEMFGAVFAKEFDASGETRIHFDRAAVGLAEECNEVPPTTCDSCEDCNNQACGVLGFCTSCQADSDCCEPLRCVSGTCELVP